MVLLTASDGRYCTATRVLPHVVLTAAHCLDGITETGTIIHTAEGDFAARRFVIHPDYRASEHVAPHPADVALVSFAAADGKARRSRIAGRQPREGEVVTFIGFGDSRTTRANEPLIKRAGRDRYMPTNAGSPSGVERTVARNEQHRGLLYFEGGPSDVGSSLFGAAATRGDSGGPLFGDDGGIVGVLIAVSQVDGATNPHRVTWAVNLAAPRIRLFLDVALRQLGAQAVV